MDLDPNVLDYALARHVARGPAKKLALVKQATVSPG